MCLFPFESSIYYIILFLVVRLELNCYDADCSESPERKGKIMVQMKQVSLFYCPFEQ